ncbi:O-antigen ligase family protein, partial [Acinetobacter baumannii]
VLLRFALHDLSRITIWQDTLTAIGNVWPVGGGFGTFQELFNSVEALETVDPAVAGRAHNDWLEVTLEAGLAGLAAL